jgi:threonine/homoserine/homoserine lactone efflux protein
MPPDQILAFFTFAVVAAVTPGPSNVLVMTAGARVGLWRGLHCLAGVVAAMALLMGVNITMGVLLALSVVLIIR